MLLPDRFIVGLGGGVFLVWAVSAIAEIVTNGAYKTPLAVHGMMGTVVGAVFTEHRLRKTRNGSLEDTEPAGDRERATHRAARELDPPEDDQ